MSKIKNIKKLVLFCCLNYLLTFGFAQQLPQFSQRMFDEMVFNPAVIGTKPVDQVLLHHRSQWAGFEGAPITQTLSYNGSMMDNMGIGGFLMNDITGPTRRLSFNLGYAYHLEFSKFKLSIGLLGTLEQYGIDGNKVTIHEDLDPSIWEGYSDRAWKPDVSLGTYLYNDDFYAGIAVMQLFTSRVRLFKNETFNATIPLTQHFYLTSGYNFHLDDEFDLQPSLLISGTVGSPMQIDFNMKVDYQKKIFGGLTYRYNDAIVMLLGLKIKQRFTFGYSYDIVISPLKKTNSGSHEIIIAFDILKDENESSLL